MEHWESQHALRKEPKRSQGSNPHEEVERFSCEGLGGIEMQCRQRCREGSLALSQRVE